MEKVLDALKVLKQCCAKNSIYDCDNGDCKIKEIIGDCVFTEVPEEWELKKIK